MFGGEKRGVDMERQGSRPVCLGQAADLPELVLGLALQPDRLLATPGALGESPGISNPTLIHLQGGNGSSVEKEVV